MQITADDLFMDRVPESRLWELTADTWIDLDVSIRSSHYSRLPSGATLMRHPAHVVLTACGRSGELRERAVLQLARHPVLWPLLVIRAVDWAPPVRDYARHLLGRVATRPEAPERMIPAAVRLRNRKGGREVLDLLRTVIAFDARADLDDRTMRLLVEDLIARQDAAAVRNLHHRMTAPSALLRAATYLVDLDDPRPFLRSRFGRIRARALNLLPHHGAEHLDDPSKIARLTAQGAVRRTGGDPVHHYRANLGGLASIEGLGESGGPVDAALVIPFLRHPRAKLRAAAVRALRGWGLHDEVAGMIHDPSTRVVRQVVLSLRASGAPVSFDLLDPVNPPHVRRAGYRLLISGDPWTRLKAHLLLLDDPDLGAHALMDLQAWSSRVMVALYRPCPEDLRAELRALVEKAPVELRGRLAWTLT